jgi:hypothetical protein
MAAANPEVERKHSTKALEKNQQVGTVKKVMHEIEIYLRKLKKYQLEFADSVLRRPNDNTAFGYGYVSGKYAGLIEAENLLLQAVEEVKIDDLETS